MELEELQLKLEAAESRALAAEEMVERAKKEMVSILSGAGGINAEELQQRLTQVTEAYDNLQRESRALEFSHGALKERLDIWKQNFFQAELRAFEAEASLAGLVEQFEGGNPQLQRLAYQDPITGLPNHNILERFLSMTAERVAQGKETAALLAIDLDRFRTVNELVGWDGGNQLLRQVGERLQKHLAGEQVALGRRGEDEFILVITVPVGPAGPLGKDSATQRWRQVANSVLELLKRPFELDGNPVHLSASVGVSVSPGDADTAAEMQSHAQAALAEAKDQGRDRCCQFDPKLQARLETEAAWEAELRVAVEADKLRYLFRPIVSIDRGVMVAADMLVLWDHPIEGTLYLAQFLATAEKTGTSVEILDRAFDRACQLSKKLRTVPVFFPTSLRQIRLARLAEEMLKKVTHRATRADQLVAELSPQALVADPERTYQVAGQLNRWGMGLAIPEVGTAQCSVWSLKTSPVDYLKLDAGLMQGVPHDDRSTAVSKAVIAMARALEMKLIVDGVGTKQQAHFLRAQGCDLAVGNLFSAPVEMDGIVGMRRQSWRI